VTSPVAYEALRTLLIRFISGEDRSLLLAGEIEGTIASCFIEGERFEDLLAALASYRPGGGPLLHDEHALVARCQAALMAIDDR
jgi:hypothetical protein